jgi:hypothetical protein
MSTLEQVAEAKVLAAVKRRLDNLDPAVLAVKHEMSARGLLRSGATVKRIRELGISLPDGIRDDMKTEYGLVLEESLWPSEHLVSRLMQYATQHFQVAQDRAASEVRQAGGDLLRAATHDELAAEISAARDRALTDVSLFLEGHRRVGINRKIRNLFTFVPDTIKGLFKSGDVK